jgi:hypothetical protein
LNAQPQSVAKGAKGHFVLRNVLINKAISNVCSAGICIGTIIHYRPEFRLKFWGGFHGLDERPLRKVKRRGGLAAVDLA